MKKIAVVEDNPDNMLLVQAMLDGTYQLDCYESGSAAIDGIQREVPDLVLLDISLPEMDGPQVLAHIRETESVRDLPVIALTAHAMSGDKEKFLAQGFDGYMSKPILDDAALIDEIERLIGREGAA